MSVNCEQIWLSLVENDGEVSALYDTQVHEVPKHRLELKVAPRAFTGWPEKAKWTASCHRWSLHTPRKRCALVGSRSGGWARVDCIDGSGPPVLAISEAWLNLILSGYCYSIANLLSLITGFFLAAAWNTLEAEERVASCFHKTDRTRCPFLLW